MGVILDITLYEARGKKEPNNQKWDRLLDEKVEEVCELIIAGKPFKVVMEMLGVKAYYFWTWKKKTIHKDLVDSAIEASAHTLAQASLDILMDGINSGTQNMAEANLRRELSKALQFSAAKRNQAFYGTLKPEKEPEKEKPALENKEEYQFILNELKRKRESSGLGTGNPTSTQQEAERVRNEPHIKKDFEGEEGFTEFEEVKE